MSFGGDKKKIQCKKCAKVTRSQGNFFLQLVIFRQWVLPTGHQNIAGFLKFSTFLTQTVTKFG
jgi:hypothetical protein